MEYSANNRPRACFEILKIIEVSTVDGNSKNYKVEWAPTWVSGAHLLGCEYLIEEFLQQKHRCGASEDNVRYNTQCREYGGKGSDTCCNVLKEEDSEQYPECSNNPNDSLFCRTELHDDEEDDLSGEKLNSDLYNNDETCSSMPNEAAVTVEFSHNMSSLVDSRNDMNENYLINTPEVVVVKSEEDIEPTELHSISTSSIEETVSQHPQQTRYFKNPTPYPKMSNTAIYGSKCTLYSSNTAIGVKLPTGEVFNSLLEEPQGVHDGKSKNAVSHGQREPLAVQKRLKSLVCEICEREFKFKSKLDRHMVKHTGLKEFQCDICLKNFSRKSDLKRHRKIHTGQTDFYCDICSKGFVQKQTLIKHMNLHSEQKTLTTNPKLSMV